MSQFLLICQWNEFAGQANGGGIGPNHNIYVDSHSPQLSNDIEPTSLTTCAYKRPNKTCDGYGWQPINLLRVLLDMYRFELDNYYNNYDNIYREWNSTILIILEPNDGVELKTNNSNVNNIFIEWFVAIGDPVKYFKIFIDNSDPIYTCNTYATIYLDIGMHEIIVEAVGNPTSLYPLSNNKLDVNVPLSIKNAQLAKASVRIFITDDE